MQTLPDAGDDGVDADTADTAPPETLLSAMPAELTSSATAVFEFSASEAGSAFLCSVDQGSAIDCTSPHEVTVSEGVHTFAVHAVDPAGNPDTTPAEYMWRVDFTAPRTALLAAPPAVDNSQEVVFRFEANEDASAFECAVDGGAWSACQSPYMAGPLTEGEHTFAVRAVDQAGNVEAAPIEHTWAIDLSLPDTLIDSGPSGPVNVTAATFAFSSPEGVSFECALDSDDFAPCVSPMPYSDLAEGCYEFRVRAWNSAGSPDPTPAVRAWCVDLTAPVTTIVQAPPAYANVTMASVEFEADEADVTFTCAVDSEAPIACQSPYIINGLGEGEHAIAVWATDAAGNKELNAASHGWTVDVTAPDTTITSSPPYASNTATASFEAEADEPGVSFECKLDSGEFEPCTLPREYADLAEGSHTVEIRAVDRAGNIDAEPAVHDWIVDVSAPDTRIESSPSGTISDATASITFAADEASVFECQLDGGAWAACTSPVDLNSLSEGAHTFGVRAVDSAGNVDATPASATWTVDLTAPDTTITGGASGLLAATSATFEFSAEAGSTFECQLDSSAWTTCTSPEEYTGLSQGDHTFRVRASDGAGNTDSSPATRSFTVDTVAPDTRITAGPSGYVSSGTVTFEFDAEADSTYQCRFDSAAWKACTSPKTYTGVSDGAHTFRVKATDAAGNEDSTPASRGFTVDTVACNTSLTSGPSGLVNTASASFGFTSSEAGSTFQCKRDSGAWAGCTSPKEYASLSQGAHTFSVRCIDRAGNRDTTPPTRSWTVDTIAPQASIDSRPANFVNTTTVSYAFSAEAGSTFQCKLDGNAWSGCTSPKTYNSLSEGAHTFSVRARDAAGNTGGAVSDSFTVDITRPNTVIETGPSGYVSSTSASFSFVGDETGVTFQCKLDGGSWGACASPKSYSSLTQGGHTFSVRAIDRAGNVDSSPATRSWTVDTVAPGVSISSGPPSYGKSTTASFVFSCTESGCTFQCKWDSGSWGACVSPASKSGLSDGSHSFSVRATDRAGNTGAAVTRSWTVDTVACNTSLTSGPSGWVNSTTASFGFSSNESGSTFQCRRDSGSWVGCTSPKKYTSLSEGSHTFRVRCIDRAGNRDSTPATRSWTVDVTAPNTSITGGPSGKVASRSASFTFTASQSGSTFQCRLDGGSWGGCSSPKSYTKLSQGSHTFKVRAIDRAGNVDSSPATRSWTVDTVGPTTTITSGPSGFTTSATATFEFTANESGSTFKCRLDGSSWATCSSGVTYTVFDGYHTFEVRATDKLGNVGPIASRTWEVDLTICFERPDLCGYL